MGRLIIVLLCVLLLVETAENLLQDMEEADFAYFTKDGTFMVRDFWIPDSWSYHSESKWNIPFYTIHYLLSGGQEIETWNEHYTRVYAGKPFGKSVPSEMLIIEGYEIKSGCGDCGTEPLKVEIE